MRLSRIICISAALLTLASTTTIAQEGHPHRGFWIGFGIGGGSAKDGDSEDALGGAAGYVRLGGTLSQKWLIGGEAIGWGRSEDNISYGRSNTTFTALFYPSQKGGFYLKGGVGFSYAKISSDILGPSVSVDKGGVGTTLGVGWDIRLGSNIFLTPNVDWLFQSIEVSEGGSLNTNLFLITLGLIWH